MKKGTKYGEGRPVSDDGYRQLAAAIVFNAVMDYMESGRTRRYRDAKKWFNSDMCVFILDMLGTDPADFVMRAYAQRRRFYYLLGKCKRAKTKEEFAHAEEELKEWWRTHFANYRIPQWSGIKKSSGSLLTSKQLKQLQKTIESPTP